MIQYNNYSLKKHHTFGMDIKAHRFIEYETEEELVNVIDSLQKECAGLPWLHIGGGSNLLFVTDFYPGTILHSTIRDLNILKDTPTEIWLRAGAGIVWDELVAYCIQRGWGGMENLSSIPGEVGASAVQNIGAYGVEVKDLIESVETIEVETSTPRIFTNKECNYAYRQSIFKKELKGKYIVTHVTYRLQKNPAFCLDYGNIRNELKKISQPLSLTTVRQAIISIRDSKLPDPSVYGNAGSFFMNPIVPRDVLENIKKEYPDVPFYEVDETFVKIPAGWMIEKCGWKGRSLGNAAVHEKQALVLINLGDATGKEVVELSNKICLSVKDKFGITIHPEVNFIGDL